MDSQGIREQLLEDLGSTSEIDYVQMYEWVGVITKLISIVSGIIVYLIIIGVPLIMSIELMYLCIPVMQVTVKEWRQKLGQRSQKAVELILRDAEIALQKANTIELGRSPILLYLLIKIKTIIISLLVVLLALQGSPVLIAWVAEVAGNVVTTIMR
jgi:hypothetical protein